MAASIKSLVQGMIQANRIMVFSKSTCPFCKMAKSALKEAGAKTMTVLEIENRSDAMDIQEYLGDFTGSYTVPAVFIAGKYLGGGSETQRLFDTGELKKILENTDSFFKKDDSS